MIGQLRDRWATHPSLDLAAALALTGIHIILVLITGRGDFLGEPGHDQRITIYTTTATIAALIGGFITAAIAQYSDSKGRRMRVLRTGPDGANRFRRNWLAILAATLTISSLCLLATILDTRASPPANWAHWLDEYATWLGALRASRLLWLFDKIIKVTDIDLQDDEAPHLSFTDPHSHV